MPKPTTLEKTRKAKAVKTAAKAPARASRSGVKQRMLKRLLAEAAIELFTAKGFDAVTITEIAEKVGIARRTFFLYFATKEDVLIQWLDDEWRHATEMLVSRHAGKAPFEAFAAALLELGAHFDANRERALAVTRITLENPTVFGREYANQFTWESLWATRLREVQKERRALQLSYDIHAAAAFAVVAVAARSWAHDPKRHSFCEWLERGFEQVRSISAKP